MGIRRTNGGSGPDMRDAIRTGIALICLTIAMCLALVFGLAYARNEGWLDRPGQRSLYIQSEPEEAENRATTDGQLWS